MAYYLHVGGSAGIAQLVEQWIENPRVSSSNLDPGNNYFSFAIKR